MTSVKPNDVHVKGKNIQALKAPYSPNRPSPKKIEAMKIFIKQQLCSFETIARMLNVAIATAEVYTIDGYCSGAPVSYKDLALKLNLGAEDMDVIASQLQKDNDGLRIVQDALKNTYSYNQIRLVLAAMIRGEM
ncbi:Hypothetical predicted protein [Paramuricea clavata]|uniref:Helicase Helix-turn-helix domain-containing protein n=1 Tax=Paramuricea clavata TaxID=317549 RepID=A0A6S7J1S0_PARCT|nr:Hypothetical predicted protein [Paramuricea clavata]